MKKLITLLSLSILTSSLNADYTQTDIQTVAATILGEARGEGSQGMLLVADVIYTRMLSPQWPATPVEVCTQPKQFHGSTYKVKDWSSFEAIWAVTLAELLLKKKDPLPKWEHTHFWSGNSTPYWARHYPIHQHRNHKFIDINGPKYYSHPGSYLE